MRTAEDFDIEPWRAYAACAEHDTDLFFPTTGEDVRPAKAVCHGCEVRMECLEHALALPEPVGIWGGTSEREHERIRGTRSRARRIA